MVNRRGEQVVSGNPALVTYTGVANQVHKCMSCLKPINVGDQFAEDLVIVCITCTITKARS